MNTLNGVPYRIDPLLKPGTIRLVDKDKPSVYVVADSQETIRRVVHFANSLTPAPEKEAAETLLGYPVRITEAVGGPPPGTIRFGFYTSEIDHVPSGECCNQCRMDYWANRCGICGTKLPCTLEKYLSGRNGQFTGSDSRVYANLHLPSNNCTAHGSNNIAGCDSCHKAWLHRTGRQ